MSEDQQNYSSHRLALWHALEATNELDRWGNHPICELGCGDGSTPFLKRYCAANRRILKSFDSDFAWAQKHGAFHIPNWHFMEWFYRRQYSVVLIDESPGEHRREALELFASHPIHFNIIVIHDSEPIGWNASDYRIRPLFNQFQFVKDFPAAEKPFPWTTVLSNEIDVTKFGE